VLRELPAKQRSLIPLALSNRADYVRAERNVIAWLSEQTVARGQPGGRPGGSGEAEQLVRIEMLKQLAVDGKLDAVIDWITSFLETDEKLVVFAQHVDVVQTLAGHFHAPSITGDTPLAERQAAIDRFQTDPDCRLIVLNLRAGGVGLTLTAASHVAFVELDWTPAMHDQAEDRVHRLGQRNAVNVWYLLAVETIDLEIYDLIERKRAVVGTVTDGAVSTGSVLPPLIERLTQRGK
jgi:SWI/SNF-related matrix-associated actin-dependent regulator of chromatin subfamily A-like protein 1